MYHFLPGQLFVLHGADSDDNPEHAIPPWNGPLVDLERVILPESHVFEHVLQGPQALHVQSTENNRTQAFHLILNALGSSFNDLTPKMTNLPGQILVLHEADSDDNPVHAFPP